VEIAAVVQMVKPVAIGNIRVDTQMNQISIPVTDRTRAVVTVATTLSEAGVELEDLMLRRPTLDEVFLHLTDSAQGHSPLEVAS
jgi:ABC-2 type transport system ATP-binding protein